MNPEIKKQWVEALRSGRYTQGWRRLRNQNDQYCCLGVLCDIVAPDAWVARSNGYESDFRFAVLPPRVFEIAKLTVSNEEMLIRMNDMLGKSFAEIADYIEASDYLQSVKFPIHFGISVTSTVSALNRHLQTKFHEI